LTRLIADALFYLVRTEWYLLHRRGRPLYDALESFPAAAKLRSDHSSEEICRAMDIACVLYFKSIRCLQRSVAMTMLLRRYGFPAEFVIGARIVPFKSHAWTELNHVVVNDKPYTPLLYHELERHRANVNLEATP